MHHSPVRRPARTRDGREYVIREAVLADARPLLAHTRAILSEPGWNVTELAEFNPTLDEQESWILSFQRRSHSIMLVADFGSAAAPEIAGVVSLATQQRRRTRHRGTVSISVLAAYRRQGIGEALLRCLLEWATDEPEIERVELSVFAHNTGAIALYEKLGFVEEACLWRRFKLSDGAYYDDIMMVKWVK